MTEPGYQGAPTPDPNAPQAPQSVPGQYVPPAGAPMPPAQVPPPPGYASADDKTWALVAHFGGAAGALFCGVLSFVAPLVALLSKGSTSPTVRAHAVAALNFQIPVSVVGFVLLVIREILLSSWSTAGWALSAFLGLLGFVVIVFGVIFGIIAGMRANEGQLYKYPVSLSLIK
jgi:uncharacterized protein